MAKSELLNTLGNSIFFKRQKNIKMPVQWTVSISYREIVTRN